MLSLKRHAARISPLVTGGALVMVTALGAASLWWRGEQRTAENAHARPAARAVEILVSGDTQGWIVPCGCTSNQSGGLLRRGSFVRLERVEHEVVVLDAGGAPAGTSPYDRLKFEAILDGELRMELAAHNLGGPELALGAEYLRDVAAQKKAPFLSANTRDKEGRPIAEPCRVVNAAGRKLAITGVVSPRYATAECHVSEPQTAVLAVRKSLPAETDALIVLAYLPEDELRRLAAALPEADMIIGGPTGQSIAPTQIGPVLLASATNKGKFLLSLRSGPGGWQGEAVEMTAEFSEDQQQQQNLGRFYAALETRDLTAAESGFIAAPAYLVPEHRVAGSTACSHCHSAESQSWQNSAHAHAWKTLADKGSQVDSFCQQCHTTGFGWSGGFVSPKRSRALANVGCESCHGPGQAHVADTKQRTLLAAREACAGCHDRENSPDFDFAFYWPLMAHGKQRE